MDVDHWVRQPCLPCSLDPSTADPFVLAASCNTGHFIFKSPLCTRTNASNYPISVLSLHPTQKTQMPRKLRKPRFKQYHMLFFIFSWLLFRLSRTGNFPSSKQYCLYVCAVLGLPLACGKYQHDNYT